MRNLDRVDPSVVERPRDRADMLGAILVADGVHAVA